MSAGACAAGAIGGVGAAVTAALHFYTAAQCLLHEPTPPHVTVCNETWFDFVIVGGGTAGAALAARLAHDPRRTVLLVEAGPDPPPEAVVPGARDLLKGSEYDWRFLSENDSVTSQALAGGRQRLPRGRMLGGCGSLNDMVYARGFPTDYQHWAEVTGDDRWNWTSVLRYFKMSEHMTDEQIVNDPVLMASHGRGGPIEVTGTKESTIDTDRFLDAFHELGFRIVKDMTSVEEFGAGRFSHTISGGRRASSLSALLGGDARPNLRVLRNATVLNVLIANGTAYGVRLLRNDKELHYYANKEVILSAGTYNTPKILLLSGIGPKDHLDELNISVVQDSPAVGANLQDHAMVLNYIAAENGTCARDVAAQHFDIIRYLHDRSGPLAGSNSMGAYLSLNASDVPDFAFYPTCMPIQAGLYRGCTDILGLEDRICSQLDAINQQQELITVATVLLKPKSRGKVRLRSADPLDSPLIYSGTFEDPEDLSGFPRVMDMVRSFANTSYFRRKEARYVELDVKGCEDLEGSERAKCVARAMGMSAWHAVGTAAMGGADARSVLDARLLVRGIRVLRVVDASAMPAVPRANTNAPVVMIAEQAAHIILEDHPISLPPSAAAAPLFQRPLSNASVAPPLPALPATVAAATLVSR